MCALSNGEIADDLQWSQSPKITLFLLVGSFSICLERAKLDISNLVHVFTLTRTSVRVTSNELHSESRHLRVVVNKKSETVHDRDIVTRMTNRKSYVAYRMAQIPMALS